MSSDPNIGYHVEPVEIDASASCVRHKGVEHVLRFQTFHVLLYLVEHAGRVVSKEELIAEIWQHAVVTDNALTQCVTEIRKALGDDSHHPVYIKTVSKIGYQFVAPIETVHRSWPALFPVHRQAERGELSPVRLVAQTGDGSLPNWSKRQKFYGVAVLALAALLLCWGAVRLYLKGPGSPPNVAPLTAGRSLVVMYFDNDSQNHTYDWLKQGLTDMMITDMSRSADLHVLGRQELATLSDDQNRAGVRNDPGMRVANAVHASDFLTGSFAAMSGQFRIDIQLHDTKTGQIIYADHSVVDNPNNVLSQVDVLASRLATAMSLNPEPKPSITEVRTKNLEAYQYYSLGVEKAQEFENAQALVLLKQAIALDPGFAMAYARIGYTYALADFAPDQGRPYLEKALQLSARLSEKDRLYVNAWYLVSKGDYEKALQTFTKITDLYPREAEAYWRAARLLRAQERPLDAVRLLKRGLSFDPNDKNLNNTLGFVLLSLHRYPEAIAAEQRYVQLAPQEPNAYDSLGMVYQQSGNYRAAASEYGTALSLNPEFGPSIIHMGDAYYQTQQYAKAIQQYNRYVAVADTDAALAFGYGDLATVYLALDHMPEARRAAALELKSNPNAVWNSLVIALKQSDQVKARRFEQVLFKNIPTQERGSPGDQRTRFYYMGYIDLMTGHSQKALTEFRAALQHLPPSSGIDTYEDCLANAELQLGQYQEAAAEYRRILKFNPRYPLAARHLAEAETHLSH